jgi:uncharacterized protein (DUF1499 family)
MPVNVDAISAPGRKRRFPFMLAHRAATRNRSKQERIHMTVFKIIGLAAVAIAIVAIGAGQLGLLAGSPPAQLGVTNGRLMAPSLNPNSVSSQASLYPDNPQQAYAAIAPIQFKGDGEAAMSRLADLLAKSPDTVIVTRAPDYIYVQCSTKVLKFTDDVEFWLDKKAGVIQFRSASRLGEKDFGVNRARMESIRAKFQA